MDGSNIGKEVYQKLGAIPAWDMSIEAMTVKLAWLLGQEVNYRHIKNQMHTSIKGEILVSNQ